MYFFRKELWCVFKKWIRLTVLGFLVLSGASYWFSVGCSTIIALQHKDAVPPSRMQTFDDFTQWQTKIQYCQEIELRGVTYYHVIGPNARVLASGGALYVFDAKGYFVGWSPDSGDVIRNEAIFYPKWWLPKASHSEELPISEIEKRIKERQ